jgi:hypothetical protein
MLQTSPRRKLRSFTEVMKHVGVARQVRRLSDSLDLAEARNSKVDLNYFLLSIPMSVSDEEKVERLSEMADTVTAIENSDVVLLGIWSSSSE